METACFIVFIVFRHITFLSKSKWRSLSCVLHCEKTLLDIEEV